MAQIARLTDRQIAEVYGKAPRKPEDEGAGGGSFWEVYRTIWRRRGWSDADIRQLWEREQGTNPETGEALSDGPTG